MEGVMPADAKHQQSGAEWRDTGKISKRVLEPIDRISEILFGLIMVLTFTCSLSVTESGQEEVRNMFVAAVGCNLAWGIIDGFIYLLGCFVERGRNIAALRALQSTTHSDQARQILGRAMPPLLASAISPAEFEAMRQKLSQFPVPVRPALNRNEWLGGFAIFLAAFLSTFPVVVPFLLTTNARLAMRLSNAVAVVMLFLTGYAFGRHAGYRPWRMGLGMSVAGSVLVAIAVLLGG